MKTFGGIPAFVSPLLPALPSPGEQARRVVRHGLADVLEWLGEEVGPAPDAMTHFVLGMDPANPGSAIAFLSRERYDALREDMGAA